MRLASRLNLNRWAFLLLVDAMLSNGRGRVAGRQPFSISFCGLSTKVILPATHGGKYGQAVGKQDAGMFLDLRAHFRHGTAQEWINAQFALQGGGQGRLAARPLCLSRASISSDVGIV